MAARKLIAAKALRFKPIPKDIVGWKVQYHDQLQTCRTCTLDIVVGHYPATLRGALLKWGVQNGSGDPMVQEQLVDVQRFIMCSPRKKNKKFLAEPLRAFKNQVCMQPKLILTNHEQSCKHISTTTFETKNRCFDQISMVNVNNTAEEIPPT